MIVQIIGGRASELFVNHLPSIFVDVARDMGEDLGVVFDDDKLKEICMTLQMPYPGDWGYKRLPNLVYAAMGPHYEPDRLSLSLKPGVLEPARETFDLTEVAVRQEKPEPDKAALAATIEHGAVVCMHTLFANKDFWFSAQPDFDPARLTLVVHDFGEMLGGSGPEVVVGVEYAGEPLELSEGAGHETDYEVRSMSPEAFIPKA